MEAWKMRERQKGGDRKERGSLRLTARGCLSLAGRKEEGVRDISPTPETEVSQPPLLGPWAHLSAVEPAAAGEVVPRQWPPGTCLGLFLAPQLSHGGGERNKGCREGSL